MRLKYSYFVHFVHFRSFHGSSLPDIFNLVEHLLDNAENGDADKHAERSAHQADDGVQVPDENLLVHLDRVRLVVDIQL